MDLDESEAVIAAGIDRRVDGLDERALAGAARTPEQGIVGGPTIGKGCAIVDQQLLLTVDADEQAEIERVRVRHRNQPPLPTPPDEGIGIVEGRGGQGMRGREPLERFGDARQQRAFVGVERKPRFVVGSAHGSGSIELPSSLRA